MIKFSVSDWIERAGSKADRRRRKAIVVFALFSVAAVFPALFVYQQYLAIPFTLGRLRNAPMADVQESLGPPEERWPAGAFDCYAGFPCKREKARGDVLFYYRGGIGYYVYFDELGRLVGFDSTGS